MSYCRFGNTMDDLMDCINNIQRKAENERDERYRQEMIELFMEIGEQWEGDIISYSKMLQENNY